MGLKEASMPTLPTNWTFTADLTNSDLSRHKAQVASDIYRALQTRLDGYRQSAAAIFLGVIAGLLTMDSAIATNFGRNLVDLIPSDNAYQIHHRIGYVLIIAAISLLLAKIFVVFVLRRIRYYFAEM